ncbi:MAG: NAD(P)H-hydrate dehydratase [Clostridiales Family XIII bacterium]|jgi:NAD(P)H-hydrate epimerase|nr:NAD(P)H-hydrate dehydratase [Clostridiales Family XIII bacterium]
MGIEIARESVRALLPPRAAAMHKGSAGRVLIVAGSPGMAGAAVLAAGAALRSGAGLVYVASDEALWPIIQTHEPCAVCVTREAALGKLGSYDAVAAGPGLGTGKAAASLVSSIIGTYDGKLVLDADALNIVAAAGAEVREPAGCLGGSDRAASDGAQQDGSCDEADGGGLVRAAEEVARPGGVQRRIITPHPGEAARLLGIGAGDIQEDREAAARRLAEKYGAVSVLKGSRTLVAAPGGVRDGESSNSLFTQSGAAAPGEPTLFENPTGNPGMATAGSGDVLTGVIVSFAAQGMDVLDAALAGVYVHGLAGDIAADEKGEYGMTASDIVRALPAAIKQVQGA